MKCPKCGSEMQAVSFNDSPVGGPDEDYDAYVCECGHEEKVK